MYCESQLIFSKWLPEKCLIKSMDTLNVQRYLFICENTVHSSVSASVSASVWHINDANQLKCGYACFHKLTTKF